MPEGGLDGVLTLLVETPKIDPPLAVKFRIPEKHEKGKSMIPGSRRFSKATAVVSGSCVLPPGHGYV